MLTVKDIFSLMSWLKKVFCKILILKFKMQENNDNLFLNYQKNHSIIVSISRIKINKLIKMINTIYPVLDDSWIWSPFLFLELRLLLIEFLLLLFFFIVTFLFLISMLFSFLLYCKKRKITNLNFFSQIYVDKKKREMVSCYVFLKTFSGITPH